MKILLFLVKYNYYEFEWDHDPVTYMALYIGDWIGFTLCTTALFFLFFWGFWKKGFREYLRKKGLINYSYAFLNTFLNFFGMHIKYKELTFEEEKSFFGPEFEMSTFIVFYTQVWSIIICVAYGIAAVINITTYILTKTPVN